MTTTHFDKEIALSHVFNLWDRGDGIGEISLFNCIVGYIHGENQLPDNYHYDELLEQYVEDEIEYTPVSCFPGNISSSHDLLKPFNNSSIDCVENLMSLVSSITSHLLPPKPKGHVVDIFSGQEKFLVDRNFDFDIAVNGKEISPNIVEHFNDFSQHLKKFLHNYPDISIEFVNHSWLNGNVYFVYQLQEKYFLHIVFTQDNQIISGAINKSPKMTSIVMLPCTSTNYDLVCDSILEALHIDLQQAKMTVNINKDFLAFIPKRKKFFFNLLINTQTDSFFASLYNDGSFIMQRNLNITTYQSLVVCFNRENLNHFLKHTEQFGLHPTEAISLFINYFFNTHPQFS